MKNKYDSKEIFKLYGKKVAVYLRGSKLKGKNYDPYRNTGHTIEKKNPVFIEAIIETIAPDSLVMKEIGLNLHGSVSLLIKDNAVSYLKLAERVEIDSEDYVTWNQALGNRVVIFKQRELGLHKVILFRDTKIK